MSVRFDSETYKVRLGRQVDEWMTEQHQRLPVAIIIDLPTYDVEIQSASESVVTMREWGWEPWGYEIREQHYFAGASGASAEVIVAAAPILHEALLNGAAALLVQHLLQQLLTLVRTTISEPPALTLEAASEQAKWTLLKHAGAAEPDLRQISAHPQEDGSYEILIRDVRRRTDYQVRVDITGAVAFADIKEVEAFARRMRDAKGEDE